MTLDEIAVRLYPFHTPDAVHDAIVALLDLDVPPRNPIAWCRRVAQRAEVNAYRLDSTRGGRPRLIHSTGVGVNPSTPGDDDDFDPSITDARLFGVQEPEQLRRLEAREELRRLDSLDIARGLGDFDPEPTNPRDTGRSEEYKAWDRWRHARKRRHERLARERGKK